MGPEEMNLEMLGKKIEAIQYTLSEQKESKIWKVLLIIVPIFLTSILGAILSKGQAQIQQSIEENGKFLSTGLALSEQYYIRELDACEKIQAQLVPLSELLQDVKVNRPYSRGDANDHLTALNEVFTAKSLYL